MNINIINIEEINNYINDYYEKSNPIYKDAKQILNDFTHEYFILDDIPIISIGEDINKKPVYKIESYKFHKYLNSRYNEKLENSIRLLNFAIKDTQSKVDIND